jgi:hypothetical protein
MKYSGPVVLSRFEARMCPFCGESAEIQPWHGGGKNKRMVSCSNEYFHVSPEVTGESRRTALARWNLRASGV